MSLVYDVLVLNGPNLNRLGRREPDIYGSDTLSSMEASLQDIIAGKSGWRLTCVQSNHEGALIDAIQALEDDASTLSKAIIINAGGLTHTSISLRDALSAFMTWGKASPEKNSRQVIEVHLSNIYAREDFRHHSYISPIATGIICGLGLQGYRLALEALFEKSSLRA